MSDAKEFEEELKAGLKGIVDDSRLEQLFEYTLRCADVFYFRQALLPGSGGRASKVDPEVRREIIAEWVQQNLKIDLGILEDTIALEKRHAALSATQNSILVALEGRFGAKARTLETRALHGWLAHTPEAEAKSPPHPPFGHLLPRGEGDGFYHLAPWGEVGRRPGEGGPRVCQPIVNRSKIKAIGIFEDDRLDELLQHAATCRTLDSFRKQPAQ